jgi:hypothetical protein
VAKKQVLGQLAYDEAGEKVGRIDDLIVASDSAAVAQRERRPEGAPHGRVRGEDTLSARCAVSRQSIDVGDGSPGRQTPAQTPAA